MKYAAVAIALVGAMALAFASYGEGAFSLIPMIGLPGLLIALFVLPLRSAARPGDGRRVGRWIAAVPAVGLLLLAVTAPKAALLPAFIALQFVLIGWPFATVGAVVMAALAVRSGLTPEPMAARRTWARLSWTWSLGIVATYSYGLRQFDTRMADIKDRVCRFDASGGGTVAHGGQSLLPLSDTSCGADTVPVWVDPLLAILAALLAVCVAGYVRARWRAR
jgi:hypothetical protein